MKELIMTKEEFNRSLIKLVHEANANELPIDDVFEVLNAQRIIAETILRLSIEKAYKERFV
jgi:hypothetical protein